MFRKQSSELPAKKDYFLFVLNWLPVSTQFVIIWRPFDKSFTKRVGMKKERLIWILLLFFPHSFVENDSTVQIRITSVVIPATLVTNQSESRISPNALLYANIMQIQFPALWLVHSGHVGEMRLSDWLVTSVAGMTTHITRWVNTGFLRVASVKIYGLESNEPMHFWK